MHNIAPITAPQLKKIWTLVRLHGLDEDLLREMLARHFSRSSTKELTLPQAARLIELLESGKHTVADSATPRQQQRLAALQAQLGYGRAQALIWCGARCGRAIMEWSELTLLEARNLIAASERHLRARRSKDY